MRTLPNIIHRIAAAAMIAAACFPAAAAAQAETDSTFISGYGAEKEASAAVEELSLIHI